MNIEERNVAEVLTAAAGPDGTVTVNGKLVQGHLPRQHQADSVAQFINKNENPVGLTEIVQNFPDLRTSTIVLAIGKSRKLDRYVADNSAEILFQSHHLLSERSVLSDEEFATRLDQLVTLAKCSASAE